MRKLVPGGSEHSFGIHVAKMAGMPEEIISRSEEILTSLESQRGSKKTMDSSNDFEITNNRQLSILQIGFNEEKDILTELKKLDVSAMSPVECLLKLMDWNKKINNI